MHMNMKLMALVALPLLARAEAAPDPVAAAKAIRKEMVIGG